MRQIRNKPGLDASKPAGIVRLRLYRSKYPGWSPMVKRDDAPARKDTGGAQLPPGLYNLGNSCFFNSVFQSLIATHAIEQLVRHQTPEAQRSPALADGALNDRRLPIANDFVRAAETAWSARDKRLRQSLSLRELLMSLGRKYDQYLDFRQQDAHELLRHLLDAISTEETDIIRSRNPPPKKRRKTAPMPADDELASFIDMVFGGTLASILVCAECKHVSVTYEPFYDLSLSLNTDTRERKRDKFASFATKIQLTQGFKKAARKPSVKKDRQRPLSVPPPAFVGLPGGSTSDSGLGKLFRGWSKSKDKDKTSQTPSRPETPRSLSARSSIDFTITKPASRPVSPIRSPVTSRVASPAPPSPRILSSSLDPPRPDSPAMETPRPAKTHFAPRSQTELDGAYLRRILADTAVLQGDGETLLDALRNFTSVERLEGDNMIGCRRCWKMKHGQDVTESSSGSESDDEDSSNEGDAHDMAEFGAGTIRRPSMPIRGSSIHYKASASVTSLPSLRVSAPDESETSESELDGDDLPERSGTLGRSVASLPPRPSIVRSASAVDVPSVPNTYIGPVPTIETTAPEPEPTFSAESSTSLHRRERAMGGREPSSAGNSIIDGLPEASQTSLSLNTTLSSPASSSTTSLSSLSHSTPPSQSTASLSRGAVSLSFSSPVPSSSRSPSPATAPEPSSTDVPPAQSPLPTPSALPAVQDKDLPPPPPPSSPRPKPAKSGTITLPDGTRLPRSKQIIPRPTLKRYLVARAPQVLVLHLKRFQQVQTQPFFSSPFRKSPAASSQFSASYDMWGGGLGLGGSGSTRFRKVDEWIEFPEQLDLAPFVAPDREDLHAEDVEKKIKTPNAHVWYRLYAVVVHIGNMLGGHYVAYAALPGADAVKAPAPVERLSDEFVVVENTTSSSSSTTSFSNPASSTASTSTAGSTTPGSTKTRTSGERQWCHISDTHVRLCSLEEVLAAKAYICFYERVESESS